MRCHSYPILQTLRGVGDLMRVAIARQDALSAYRCGIDDRALSQSRVCLPEEFVPKIHWTEAIKLREKYGTGIPLCCLVARPESRRCLKALTCKVSSQIAARESFLALGGDSYIASPELCAFGIAKQCDVIETALVISELCSLYSLSISPDSGFRSRPPLSSLEQMTRLANDLKRAKGLKVFLEAIGLSVQDSASPMETAVALLLSLPSRYGGFSLPKPEMNWMVRGKEALRDAAVKGTHVSKGSLFGDLVFLEHNLIVEYASKKHHQDHWDSDMIRYNELVDDGFKVVSITPTQLFDATKMMSVAGTIARQLGCVLPSATPEWASRNMRLRKLLLG